LLVVEKRPKRSRPGDGSRRAVRERCRRFIALLGVRLAVMLGVMLARLAGVVGGVCRMTMRGVRMVRRCLVRIGLMMLCSFAMVLGSVLVMLGSGLVMLDDLLLGHDDLLG